MDIFYRLKSITENSCWLVQQIWKLDLFFQLIHPAPQWIFRRSDVNITKTFNMKTCPVCQTPVIGRSDKKFCSDDCRATYHNDRNRDRNKKIRSINRILRRNRNILGNLLMENHDRISKSHLLERGFNFNYYTRERSENGSGYKSCYDISYSLVEEEKEQYVIILRGVKK